jgi:hypothetical protein
MLQEYGIDKTIADLIGSNAALAQQLNAKQKRIDHLEMVLQQRHIETRRAFDPDKINEMIEKVYLLWLEASPGTGFTYEEAQEEFYQKWRFRSSCVPQRMRDLRKEGRLWSKEDPSNSDKVTFYLTLKGNNQP